MKLRTWQGECRYLETINKELLEALKTAKNALDYAYFQKGVGVLKELQFVEQALAKAEKR